MNRRLSGAALGLFFMVSAVSALAQPAEEPSLDNILDRYIRALGGKAAIRKLTSRVAKGTITFPAQGITGNIEAWTMFPDKLLVITDLPGIGRLRQGYDGTVGWVEDPQTGIRQVTGVELDDLRRSAVFDRALHMKDVFPDLAVKDRETINGKDVWVLETKLDPLTYRMYFAVDTGLMSRFEMDQAQDGGGKSTITLDAGDYRPVAGVMVPYSIKESGPAMGWEEKFTEIAPNVAIDESFFARPRAGSTP
jgi:outer membrane lipoprotein-sorting protein